MIISSGPPPPPASWAGTNDRSWDQRFRRIGCRGGSTAIAGRPCDLGVPSRSSNSRGQLAIRAWRTSERSAVIDGPDQNQALIRPAGGRHAPPAILPEGIARFAQSFRGREFAEPQQAAAGLGAPPSAGETSGSGRGPTSPQHALGPSAGAPAEAVGFKFNNIVDAIEHASANAQIGRPAPLPSPALAMSWGLTRQRTVSSPSSKSRAEPPDVLAG